MTSSEHKPTSSLDIESGKRGIAGSEGTAASQRPSDRSGTRGSEVKDGALVAPSVSSPHSEPGIVIDTARFLSDHPENAGVSDAIKLARAYVDLFEHSENLRAGLEELLSVAERIRGGDTKLDPEEWYAARDYAKRVLGG